MGSLDVLPYELYSDAPGTLFVKHEWEAADAAHAPGHYFGDVPKGWPKKLTGPQVWEGKDLEAHRIQPPSLKLNRCEANADTSISGEVY